MWDPDQYLAYADHRRRPVFDLLARTPPGPIERIIDLGCGPGNLTDLLRQRWPEAHIVAIDSDEAMIDRARHEHAHDQVTYISADIGQWEPDEPVDLVFSNAALHWIPDHIELVSRFVDWLGATGTLAFQVPGNTHAPSHVEVAALRASARWAQKVGAGAEDHLAVESPQAYARAVAHAGRTPDAWETTYVQILTGEDPVVEWLSGSTLRPVLAALDADEQRAFTRELAERLRPHYPSDDLGRTYFGFRRIFVVGRP